MTNEEEKDDFLSYVEALDDEEIPLPVAKMELTGFVSEIAIMTKEKMYAFVKLTAYDQGGFVTVYDPRKEEGVFREYTDIASARENFERAINTSTKRGWVLVHKGYRNWG